MANVVRAAIVQTEWTGDKDSMIKKHEDYARQAAEQGAQVMCFQEIFYGPYFCQVQDNEHFDYAEPMPGRADLKAMQDLAKETGMVLVVPDVREGTGRLLLQHRRGHRRRRHATWASTARPTSPTSRASGRSSISGPATRATRCSTPPSAGSASTSATTATSPRAGARLGCTAPRSSSTPRPPAAGLSMYLWKIEQPAAAVANEYFIGAINRVGQEPAGRQRLLRLLVLRRPAGPDRRRRPPPTRRKNWSCATSTWTWSTRSARPGPSTGTAGPTPTETWSPLRACARSDPGGCG